MKGAFLGAVGAAFAAALLLPAAASSAEAPFFLKVSPRGTWLTVDPQDRAYPPTSAKLSRFNVKAGDFLAFRSRGGYKAGQDFQDDARGALAVFRRGGKRLAPGSDYSPGEFHTEPTCSSGIPTDVAQDFELRFDEWTVAQVPKGADNIAFGSDDCFRDDNSDPNADYGVEIVTFSEVMWKSVTLKSTPTSVDFKFRPNFDVPLRQAAHLGGYDHFNLLLAVTEFSARVGGTAGRMTQGRCSSDPSIRQMCAGLRNKNGIVPLPARSSQRVFIIVPIYGGFQSEVDDFGRPFPVRDSRPWLYDEVYGPRGERSGKTELEALRAVHEFNVGFRNIADSRIGTTTLLGLAGVRKAAEGDLLVKQGATVTWDFPPAQGKKIRLVRLDAVPDPIAASLARLGVSVRALKAPAAKRR